jgi:hypothetical protein
VEEFRALGRNSFPMCRALAKALVGRSLEFNTMSFDELQIAYRALLDRLPVPCRRHGRWQSGRSAVLQESSTGALQLVDFVSLTE